MKNCNQSMKIMNSVVERYRGGGGGGGVMSRTGSVQVSIASGTVSPAGDGGGSAAGTPTAVAADASSAARASSAHKDASSSFDYTVLATEFLTLGGDLNHCTVRLLREVLKSLDIMDYRYLEAYVHNIKASLVADINETVTVNNNDSSDKSDNNMSNMRITSRIESLYTAAETLLKYPGCLQHASESAVTALRSITTVLLNKATAAATAVAGGVAADTTPLQNALHEMINSFQLKLSTISTEIKVMEGILMEMTPNAIVIQLTLIAALQAHSCTPTDCKELVIELENASKFIQVDATNVVEMEAALADAAGTNNACVNALTQHNHGNNPYLTYFAKIITYINNTNDATTQSATSALFKIEFIVKVAACMKELSAIVYGVVQQYSAIQAVDCEFATECYAKYLQLLKPLFCSSTTTSTGNGATATAASAGASGSSSPPPTPSATSTSTTLKIPPLMIFIPENFTHQPYTRQKYTRVKLYFLCPLTLQSGYCYEFLFTENMIKMLLPILKMTLLFLINITKEVETQRMIPPYFASYFPSQAGGGGKSNKSEGNCCDIETFLAALHDWLIEFTEKSTHNNELCEICDELESIFLTIKHTHMKKDITSGRKIARKGKQLAIMMLQNVSNKGYKELTNYIYQYETAIVPLGGEKVPLDAWSAEYTGLLGVPVVFSTKLASGAGKRRHLFC